MQPAAPNNAKFLIMEVSAKGKKDSQGSLALCWNITYLPLHLASSWDLPNPVAFPPEEFFHMPRNYSQRERAFIRD